MGWIGNGLVFVAKLAIAVADVECTSLAAEGNQCTGSLFWAGDKNIGKMRFCMRL